MEQTNLLLIVLPNWVVLLKFLGEATLQDNAKLQLDKGKGYILELNDGANKGLRCYSCFNDGLAMYFKDPLDRE